MYHFSFRVLFLFYLCLNCGDLFRKVFHFIYSYLYIHTYIYTYRGIKMENFLEEVSGCKAQMDMRTVGIRRLKTNMVQLFRKDL